ncbi:MAG: S1/P1 nuclease [Colwellia sp.]|nr:S1/P1 nuclease [Colwellia sp.]
MMKTYFLYLLLLMSFLLFSSPSLALNKLGHQLVCQLAFEHIGSQQQTKITQLLATLPKNHQNLINRYNYRKKGTSISFANACTWADAVKRIKKFKRYNSWHYMNVPRSQISITTNTCQKNCLPQAILYHQQQLKKNTNKVNWQQAQALLFLGHWLGDIHQPLHVSFASDLGGNKIKLTHLTTKCSNLHWYWDDCILYRGKYSKKKWLRLLNSQWQQNSTPNWQASQVWQWADESFQLIKTPSFMYCKMDKYGTCQPIKQKIRLPKNYIEQYQPVIEKRLLQASKRLAKVLTATL